MEGFFCGTAIHCGPGALSALPQLVGKRLLVVTDPYFYENGVAKALAEGTKPEQCTYFHEITPDPSAQLAARGAATVRSFQPDTVLALGGGSAMDCAKAMVYFSGLEVPVIAVPTTSGSGAEVTDFAILTHDGVKHPLVDPKLRPQYAVVDPELVEKLPKGLIAEGGFDMLTHALESYVAAKANGFTDGLAAYAFRTGMENLLQSQQGDLCARGRIHTAATMAALAFTNAGLGVCHALSHSLGGALHVSHGKLNAILLPAVLEQKELGKLASLARLAGIDGASDTIARRNLRNALCRLRRELGLPATLAEAGIAPRQVMEQRSRILKAALADPCCATAPYPVDERLLDGILRQVIGS